MEPKNDLGPLLGWSAHLARERMDARMSHIGITPAQTHVLVYLHRSGGQASQRELVEHLRVRPPTANGILDRLEENGLVVRSVIGSEARRRLITLTEKGEELQEQARLAFRDAEEMLSRGLAPEERAALVALLHRVISNLEEDRTIC